MEDWQALPLTETEKLLTGIVAEHRYWEVWRGVADVGWYARYPRSSPPAVAGPVPLEELSEAIWAVRIERGF